jgi:hypothetical protein
MEGNKRNFDVDSDHGKKKVCFVPGAEVLDYMDGDYDGRNGDENDLDLDTLAPTSRSRRIKKDVYSDEEDTRSGWDLDDEERKDSREDDDGNIGPPKIDSESSGEEVGRPESDDEESQPKITPFNMRQEREEGY